MSYEIKNGERITLHMRHIDSPLFSEVYFVLRRPGGAPIGNIVAEARRVIREYTDLPPALNVRRRRRSFRAFLSGAFAGIAASAAAVSLIALIMS